MPAAAVAAPVDQAAERDRVRWSVGGRVDARGMNTTALLLGALLLVAGFGIGIGAGWLWWRGQAGRTPGPALEVAAILAPASDALVRVEQRLREVERARAAAYAGLYEPVAALHRTSTDLGAQSRTLVNALRAPAVRGRWGEIQLQRIVELAGMVEHCDFDTQVFVAVPDSAGVRPDMVVRLAGGRHIPVDAKVPFDAWLQARENGDQTGRSPLMTRHARAMRAHVDSLAAKAYWQHFQPAPEFVVMFVPGEPLLDAAMTIDPGLAEYAFARNVVIATPTTLIALLRTVAFTWRQARLSESAAAIHGLGRELHGRLATLGSHLSRLGSSLDRAVESYNAAIGSVENRVLVTARRFSDMGVGTGEMPTVEPVTSTARPLQAPEWYPDPGTTRPTLEELASGELRQRAEPQFGDAAG